MQEASADTVLGDFAEAEHTLGGMTSRFFQREGRFLVRTQGSDGTLREHAIAYTFGVEPLQQYLVAFPGGRLQALGIAWDARPAAAGGQRWFSLYPDAPPRPGDPLHWTGIDQTWNFMCAECHSTGLQKSYRPDRERYETRWAEIDVSCEACHGPGSAHAAWAASERSSADPRLPMRYGPRAHWDFDQGARIARPDRPGAHRAEVESCGRCHSRRAVIREDYVHGQPLLETHLPSLLDAPLYFADGQILGEVYEWGSFRQSRMYAAGVACSDCHEPHALRIAEPDAACGRCHAPAAFATAAHHHHRPGTAGSSCVACHMPARTYMVVDERRDHGFRVPRPDLSAQLGTPDACTSCHADRASPWVEQSFARWYPDRVGAPHWGVALAAGRNRLAGAAGQLEALIADASQPAIVRASALQLLGPVARAQSLGPVRRSLADPDPLVRRAALQAAGAFEPRIALALAAPLLRDRVLGVRIEAVDRIADVPRSQWPPELHAPARAALADYRRAQLASAERAEARLNLGALHARLGELDEARREYELAQRLDPSFTPSYVNLADVERQSGRDAEAERVLRRGLARAPEAAELHYALGLTLVRLGRSDQALAELRRALQLAPTEPRYGLSLAIALRDTGHREQALHHARALARQMPDDPAVRQLVAELEER
jgi:tetratricopeptide (TPR) repeat protein